MKPRGRSWENHQIFGPGTAATATAALEERSMPLSGGTAPWRLEMPDLCLWKMLGWPSSPEVCLYGWRENPEAGNSLGLCSESIGEIHKAH